MENYRLNDIKHHIHQIGVYPIDVLLVGATGVGKSSSINMLFGKELASVGYGSDPETMLVEHYRFSDVLRFWDSPGLGDGQAADLAHHKKLTDVLCKTYEKNGTWGFIDLVMVILDGSSRDMGTTYRLLETTIAKLIEPERIITLINQADMAMKGRYWNEQNNCPQPELKQFLEDKAHSVQARLLEATGLNLDKPIYYSAAKKYNQIAVLDFIIKHLPTKKRVIAQNAFVFAKA